MVDGVTCRTVRYNPSAFPRFSLLQRRLKDFQNVYDSLPPETLRKPHLRFISDSRFAKNLHSSNGQFSITGILGHCVKDVGAIDSSLIVSVCILQPDESGKLTDKDNELLTLLKDIIPHNELDTVLFAVNATECTFQSLEQYSKDISNNLEPLTTVNTIFHRLFSIKSTEMSVRISLCLEKNLLEKFPVKITKSGALEAQFNAPGYIQEFGNILKNGPFGNQQCKDFLRRKANDFQWGGEFAYRLPWNIQKVKNQVKIYLFECLSKEIALVLMQHLTQQLYEHNVDFAKDLEKLVDLSVLTKSMVVILSSYIAMILAAVLGMIPAFFAIAAALLFSEDVMNTIFRNEIADIIHERIMSKKDDIIKIILRRFREVYLEYMEMCDVLNVFAGRNDIDTSFHKYKTITERNLKIKACGQFGKIIKIYIHKKFTSEHSIQKYLSKYSADVSNVKICEDKLMTIKEHSLKPGTKVQLSNQLSARYGTVSFPLKDEEHQYYCATCKHVTEGSDNLYIQSDNGHTLPLDSIYKSQDVDFALLKLRTQNISCSHGIRYGENEFLPGELLENGLTPSFNDIVYKWGATTAQTFGKYQGVICRRRQEQGYYDIETFIIEGLDNQFSREGDSGSLVCIQPDGVVFKSHMAAFILIGELGNYDGVDYSNTHACYRVSVPLMEMKNTDLCRNIEPCFYTLGDV
ncbi:unnamed protein product [Mytilus coruscus]|uniref:Peptidase S1 domain-containing protein n=1 Tax=Mytilus coruscus TaxID=42192 RepID=A0A6J8CIV9_MYTCO|nr:unnamed protein product [Mytilus coruscus]